MEIRTAAPQDLPAVTRLEALCFPRRRPPLKAAFRDRLAACPQTCWLLWEGDTLLAMVNGMTVQTPDLTDAMYETTALHDPAGPWLMIFGVDTHPDHRRRGYAGRLLRHAIQAARDQGRAGVVLTCKERLLPYYAKFGFVSEGCPPRCMAGRCGTRCGWLFEGGPAAVGVGPRWAAFFWGLPTPLERAGTGACPAGAPFLGKKWGPAREGQVPAVPTAPGDPHKPPARAPAAPVHFDSAGTNRPRPPNSGLPLGKPAVAFCHGISAQALARNFSSRSSPSLMFSMDTAKDHRT